MKFRYLPYLAVPLLLLAFLGGRWIYELAAGSRAGLSWRFEGEASEASLLEAASRAGGGPRLVSPAEGYRPGLLVLDRGLRAPDPPPPPGGSPFSSLEEAKNAAWGGGEVLLGYQTLAASQGPALGDLEETAGIGPVDWIGVYTLDLEKEGSLPFALRAAWSAQSGRAWSFRGDGLVLYAPRSGRILVLRRGVELGPRALRLSAAASEGRPGTGGGYAGWFCLTRPSSGTRIEADFSLDLLEPGRKLLATEGLPAEFPALLSRPYGRGRIWTLAADLGNRQTSLERLPLLPSATLESRLSLDSPENGISRYWRLVVPLVSRIASSALARAEASAAPAPTSPYEFRAGRQYLERRSPGGDWEPWFVRGVDLGASVPGSSLTEPRSDDAYWMETLGGISAAGFDSLRIYTLLPPAFYRALARFNSTAARPLFFFQGIWLDEDAPKGDLLDPAWSAAQLAESDRCVEAVHGRASIAPRRGRSWGDYRVDASPWLVAYLVGREILPEEFEATSVAHPGYSWQGRRFSVEGRQPLLSFLASWAERVQVRDAELGGPARPIGFVSWPTLDPLRHPGEWELGSARAPYQDRDSLDLRALSRGPDEAAGFFAAYHIYPNYPDFLVREARYDLPDPSGAARYGAYLADLRSVLPPVPLLVAEFGLATGYGTAHLHPEGLDHGGLSEGAQARGLLALFRSIARSGAGGGMVFEWSDEWAKKTWSTEPYMIPFDRHPLWHNAADPEQNYGLLAWKPTAPLSWTASGTGLRAAEDPEYFYLSLPPQPAAPGRRILEIGLDTLPGEHGDFRLDPGGALSPQGSEFKLWVGFEGGRFLAARLLAAAGYDRGAGRLDDPPSYSGGFAEIRALVNAAKTTSEGRSFPDLYEDGSILPQDSASGPGLVSLAADGSLQIRIPWTRLNVSDPSSRRVLLDPRDTRSITAEDAVGTRTIASIGLWGFARTEGAEPVFLTDRERPWQVPLRGWETVDSAAQPKQALGALASFLAEWRPLGNR